MPRKAPAYQLFTIRLILAWGILFSFVTIFIYWLGLYGPFLLDDLQSIIPTQIKHFSWTNLISVSLQNETGPLGRPLSTFTLALNGLLFGNNAFYFKAVNLVLHLLNGIAVGIFVYLIVSFLPKRRNLALATTLLTTYVWLIHPLQVSTVLYVVQRMTQISTLFTVIGLNLYLIGRLRQITRQNHWLIFILISFLCFFPLSVLSKETGLLFPWYVFCLEYFILKFRCPTQRQKFTLVHFHRFLSLSLILLALLYFYYKIPTYFALYSERDLTLISRLLTESKVLVFYLSLILKPRLSDMGLYHDDFAVSYELDSAVLLSMGLLLSMLFCIAYCRRRAPIIAFGLAWFLISQVIESTFIPLELVFEHRNYLALLGIVLIPCYYFVQLIKSKQSGVKVALLGGALGILTVLTLLTFFRTLGWSSNVSFLYEASIYHPLSARTHIELSNWELTQKNYPRAINELQKAASLQPNNIGIVLHQILIGCQTQDVKTELYEQAEHKIKKAAITPYTIMVLDQLVQNIVMKECVAVSKKHIETIIQNGISNPTLRYKPLYQAVLYHLEAGIAFSEGNIPHCLALLMKSYQTYPHRLDPLIQKATIEWSYQLYQDANATREIIQKNRLSIKAPHDKIQALDKLFDSRK
jgi:protein O-mannosyl-transferase